MHTWAGSKSSYAHYREREKTAGGKEGIFSSIPAGGMVSPATVYSCNRLPAD
jgi:hypothetical protein